MLSNGQTLKHKYVNRLARLDPTPGETWAWDISKKTAFIAEDGAKFIDDIDNYTHIEDELGRPYAKQPKEGQFVDESAKKYLVSKEKMAEMRQKRLEEWEAEVLDRMENGSPGPYIKTMSGVKVTCYPRHSSDIAGKYISCPFADGSDSLLFKDFFLKRRKATPLYRKWNMIKKEYMDGPMVFRHTDGQLWIYDRMMHSLGVLEEGSINMPEKEYNGG